MEVSGQPHAPAALPSWKTPMTIECTLQFGCIGSLLWEGRINYFCLWRIRRNGPVIRPLWTTHQAVVLIQPLAPLCSIPLTYIDHFRWCWISRFTDWSGVSKLWSPGPIRLFKEFIRSRRYWNTLRTGSFKLFKRPFPGFLTILTL